MLQKESFCFIASLVFHGLLVVVFYNTSLQNIRLFQVKKGLNRPATLVTELSLEKKQEVKKAIETFSAPVTKALESMKEKKQEEKMVFKPKASTYVIDLSQNQIPEEFKAFFTSLIEEIHKKKHYPALSKRLRESGVVHIEFEVSLEGKVQNVMLKKSCNYKRLNKSALQVVSNLEIKKLPPKSYGKIEITFPMEYIL